MMTDLCALLFGWVNLTPRYSTPVMTLEQWGPGL